MDVQLKLNGEPKEASVQFAQRSDFAFAKNWEESIGTDQNPIRRDTIEYAGLAIKRYEAAFETGIYANNLHDFTDHIECNPNVEVGGLIVLRCDWFSGSQIIGFSHFRRTWCNKIVLDYLGTHPLIARRKNDTDAAVEGVGVSLLYFISSLLEKENCEALWGEATKTSAPYYQRVFQLERVEDLIFAPRQNVLNFARKIEDKWKHKTTESTQSLNEIYAFETENPPFVGSKAAVFNPSKRLAFRFLKLPPHKQIAVAQNLNLLEGDHSGLSQQAFAQIIFTGAKEKGLLADLWRVVEKEYGDGVEEENPFKI